MKKQAKTHELHCRVHQSTKKAFRKACKEKGVSMSQMIEQFILSEIVGTEAN